MDCEGKNLSRTGPIGVLQVGTRETCFVIDVCQLGTDVVAVALKEVLEDESVVKLMFDCRRDSDAMLHQLGIRLRNVRDLQLKEIMCRHETAAEHRKSLSFLGKNVDREPHLYEHVYQLKGLRMCLGDWGIVDAATLATKKTVAKQFRDDPDFWLRRPLSTDAIDYAQQDVLSLFSLDEQLPAVPEDDWKKASEAYESFFRDSAVADARFVEHGFLPLHVVPGIPPPRGALAAVQECCGCLRSLPSDSVPHRRSHSHYCTLCYVIDVMHRNRAFAEQMQTRRRNHSPVMDHAPVMAFAIDRSRRPNKGRLGAGEKPCAFFRKPAGCRNGSACHFSHSC